MALIPTATLTVDTASEVLTLTDTTGAYNASTNPGGYGAPNPAIADNTGTLLTFTLPDLSPVEILLDGTTSPATNWIPLNALTRSVTIAQLGLTSDTLPTGAILLTYLPFFTTTSGGNYTVVQGNATITRASAQNPSTDYSDSDIWVSGTGVPYTILTKTATTLVLTELYAEASGTTVGYRGYQAQTAVLTPYEFLVCLNSQWANLRWDGCHCKDPKYTSLNNLRNMYQQVLAKMAATDYTGANLEMIDLAALCTCVEEGGGGSCGCG